MKNFSELLDIDRSLTVSIGLSAIIEAGTPWVTVSVNGETELDDPLTGSALILTDIDCQKPWSIEIAMKDKTYLQDRETAVIINHLKIDGHDLIPRFTYLARYINDHQRDESTNYLGWNGIWVLDSDLPFYQWLHHNTGQGWLLKPMAISRDCVASSSNNISMPDRSVF